MNTSPTLRPLPVRLSIVFLALRACLDLAAQIAPGEPLNYRPLALQPEKWDQHKVNPTMIPWKGRNVVFLTAPGEYDPHLMSIWIERLDAGWQTFLEITRRAPKPHKQLEGKATIAAPPNPNLSCGVGCGFIGATGIELGKFYTDDLPSLKKDPQSMPHYAYYEMGRNFYTFEDRHSCFITGFAVLMRYVCMDALKCHDTDLETRRTIESVEAFHRKSSTPFIDFFTGAGNIPEHVHRLKLPDGTTIQPSDQPVTYASAMLRLHRELGGNPWLERFFTQLAQCPEAKPKKPVGALTQSWHWFVCASIAAQRNLAPIFCDEWRLPLSPNTRAKLDQLDWKAASLNADSLLKQISPEWIPTTKPSAN